MANERPLTPDEITRMITDQERCLTDTAYADAVIMEAQQIEGTRYKFRLTEQRPER